MHSSLSLSLAFSFVWMAGSIKEPCVTGASVDMKDKRAMERIEEGILI